LNLCELLGIDVEAIALRIAMGEEDEQEEAICKRKTATSINDSNEDSCPFKRSLNPKCDLIIQKRERSLSSTELLKDKIVPSCTNSTQVSQHA